MTTLNRRAFSGLLAAGLAAPMVTRASAREKPDLEALIAPLDQLHSLQIQHGGAVLFAQAPRGPGLDRIANIKSCSKSLVALLLGSCIAHEEISSVDARLVDVAPDLVPANATEGVEQITMEDLVTLRAGLEGTSGGDYGAWIASSNWVEAALTRPMESDPGRTMIYSTGTTHVLGAVLAQVSGMSLLALARDRLGAPMGFEIPPWAADPQGFYLGGNEMGLTPRAMLAIALLMRDRGRYEGSQIVPAAWIETSRVPRATSRFSGLDYGYGWFLTESDYVLAHGYGGQMIAAHPEKNLAVAITSDPTRPARSRGFFGELMDLLEGPILEMADET